MTTPLALAQVRLDQATAAREAAEQTLVAAMAPIDPSFPPLGATVADAVTWRSFEGRLEDPHCDRALLDAYSRYRRAQRAETKARSAAYRARLAPAPAPAPKPAPRPRKPAKKTTVSAHMRQRWEEEAEARAA